jgi:hypothetical protein
MQTSPGNPLPTSISVVEVSLKEICIVLENDTSSKPTHRLKRSRELWTE